MTSTFSSLLHNTPLLFLIVYASVLGVGNPIGLLGGAVWLWASSRYLIPRKINTDSINTVPLFLKRYYGSYMQIASSVLFICYFWLLMTQAIAGWSRVGYFALGQHKYLGVGIVLLIAATFLSILLKGRLSLWLVCCVAILGCMPFLMHQFGGIAQNKIAFPLFYASKGDIMLLWLTLLGGHPLLSQVLLKHNKKPRVIDAFRKGSLFFLCIGLIEISLKDQLNLSQHLPILWQYILFFYLTVKYFLAMSLFFYKLYELMRITTQSSSVRSLIVLALGLSAAISIYTVPRTIFKPLTLVITLLTFWVYMIFLMLLIGVESKRVSIILPLGTIAALSVGLIIPHHLFRWLYPPILLTSIGLVLLLLHGRYGFRMIKRNWWEQQAIDQLGIRIEDIQSFLKKLVLTPIRLITYAKQGVARQQLPYFQLNIYLTLMLCTGISLLPIKRGNPYIEFAYLALLFALVLCIGLYLQPVWARFFTDCFAAYWYLFLAYALVSLPLLIYAIADLAEIALVYLATSLLIVARLTQLISFLSIILLGFFNAFLMAYSFAPAILATLREPSSLQTLGYVYSLTFIAGMFFIRQPPHELQRSRKKLQILIKNFIGKASNVLGIAKSHASLVDLCMSSMKVREEQKDGSKQLVITMDPASYEMMKSNTEALLKVMHTGKSQLKDSFTPIHTVIQKRDLHPCDVVPCLKEAIESFMQTYEINKKPTLLVEKTFHFQGTEPTFIAMVLQLLRNAYEHSQTKGKITIRVNDHKVYISNDHSDIPYQDSPHIFNEFFTTMPESNLGLGLFFASEVMETFGGSLYLQRNRSKQPICFVLSFPK